MQNKVKVGLIYGGKSGEHEVSLQTALAVIKAFDHDKYDIYPFYITKEGNWRAGQALLGSVEDKKRLQLAELQLTELQLAEAKSDALTHYDGMQSIVGVGQQLDVIFPLLHGTFGEDGTIQGLLEMANLPYVGAGVLASAVGMDKVMMKKIFAQEGLPQCLYCHFTRTQWQKEQKSLLTEIETTLGFPCFVKPANLGSSVGISKAHHREELLEAIACAFKYDRKVIIEENVVAREIEVAVLGNDEPQASVPGEIVTGSEFYDYTAKYVDGKSEMIIPASISSELTSQLQHMAVRAFRAIDGSGLARVDFFIRKSDNRCYINEINTMPGFTPFSMYPLLWRESGKPYSELLDNLIELALQRHTEKQLIDYD